MVFPEMYFIQKYWNIENASQGSPYSRWYFMFQKVILSDLFFGSFWKKELIIFSMIITLLKEHEQ